MPSAVPIEAAELVKDELNAGSLGFTATREYLTMSSIQRLADMRVIVTPSAETTAAETRGHIVNGIQVDVGLFKKLTLANGEFTTAELDALMLLSDQIKDHMKHKRLGEGRFAWVGTAHDPMYDPELLESHIFGTVISFTYRHIR